MGGLLSTARRNWAARQSGRPSLPGAHCQQMCTEPANRRFPLQGARDAEQILPLSGIGPTFVEVRQDPSRTFEPEHALAVKPRRHDFGLQLLRTMEIRRREVIPLVRL